MSEEKKIYEEMFANVDKGFDPIELNEKFDTENVPNFSSMFSNITIPTSIEK